VSNEINRRLGDEGALRLYSVDGVRRECVGEWPKSFFEAILRARLRALAAALDATPDGEDDREGGTADTGAGGKVIAPVGSG
jgi:hypothetical protein